VGKSFLNRMLLALTALLLPCSVAFAAGLGKITVLSALGQPLRAEIEIVALQPGEGDTLSARLAAVESYRQAGVDLNGALLNVRFAVQRRPNGEYVVSMTSNQPLNEPFIDMLVELHWANGRLTREYTFLLDPPEYKGPGAGAAIATPTLPVTPPIAQALPAPRPPVEPRGAPEARPRSSVEDRPAVVPVPGARAAAPAPAQSAESAYTVKRGDTLVKIALQTKPEGVSLQQTLVALYRGNQDAFDGNNMNRLRAGKILNVPSKEAAASLTQEEAVRVVNSQSADYRDYRNKIGAAVAAAPPRSETGRQSAGRIGAPREDKPGPAADAGKDQLRLSRPDDGKAGARAGGAGKADDLAARDKALKEANERIALLEKNLQELQKLAQLKSSAAAQVQESAKAAAAKADTPKPAAPAPAADAGTAAAAAKAESMKSAAAKADAAKSDAAKVDGGKGAAPAVPADSEKAAAEAAKPPADAAKAAPAAASPGTADASKAAPDAAKPAPKPPAKAITPPPPPPSFVDELLDDPVTMGAGAAVILGLFGYGFYALRKKRKAQAANANNANNAASNEMAALSVSAMGVNSVPGPEVGRNIDSVSLQGDITPAAAAKMDTEEIDPIAEADVYMAYGRDTQAEEILKEALAKDSNRQAIKVKLLEIYANRKDTASFALVANDLHEATGGTGPDWEKAMALGVALDPHNALYGGIPAPAAQGDMQSTQILNLADLAPAAPSTHDLPLQEATPETSSGLDFDLDIGAEPAQRASQPGIDMEPPAPAKEESSSGGLDFDLDLGGDKPQEGAIDFSADAQATGKEPVVSDTASAGGQSSGGLDIDFDLAGDDKKTEEGAAPAADSGLDFDLGGDKVEIPPEEKPVEMDLAEISFDLGTPGNGAGEAPVMDAHWQEVATKLDLAKAYQDMGDKDGARELLNEVLNEGDHTQQSQAKSLLEALEA